LRREIRHLIAEVRADSIALEAASVILRAYRVLVSLEELRQRSVETDTLRAEIADLKAAMNIS